jgi:hypothetical protein
MDPKVHFEAIDPDRPASGPDLRLGNLDPSIHSTGPRSQERWHHSFGVEAGAKVDGMGQKEPTRGGCTVTAGRDPTFPASCALFTAALASLPEVFEERVLLDWFRSHARWVDPLWVQGRLVGNTVNDPGRQHIPEPKDLLFLRVDGTFERYNPLRHGRWGACGRRVRDF